MPFFGGGFHDIRKPSPLAHGIGVGDGLEGRVLAFEDAGASDTSSPAQVSSSEFHLVHDVLHVQVHVEGYQSNAAAGQLDRVVTTCSEKNYRWYKLFCKKKACLPAKLLLLLLQSPAAVAFRSSVVVLLKRNGADNCYVSFPLHSTLKDKLKKAERTRA